MSNTLSQSIWRQVFLFALVAIGAVCIIAAFGLPRFREVDGSFKSGICLPVAAGLAFCLIGSTFTLKIRRSAFWFAVALVGQALALQMIEAGPQIRYQHYMNPSRLFEWPAFLLVVGFTGQCLGVVLGIKTHWSTVHRWLRDNFSSWQLVCIAAVLSVSSAAVSRDVRLFVFELPWASLVQLINLANVVLIALTLPEDHLQRINNTFRRWFRDDSAPRVPSRLDAFSSVGAVWVVLLASLLSWYSYGRHPHIPDEVSYIYQARYFAAGMLVMRLPPVPEAFNLDLMNYEATRWYSPVPPGWPAVLAFGVLLGVPWLVNPILAGLNVLLAYLVLQELYSLRLARLAVVLLCTSPWHIFMAMNFMTHTLSITCALVAIAAMIRARKTGKIQWAALCGVAAGMVGIVRPLEGAIVMFLLSLWAIGIGGRRLKLLSIACFCLGASVIAASVLFYNKALTGSATTFPLMAYTDKYYGKNSNAMGFGSDRGLGWQLDPYPGHGFKDVVVNSELNAFSLNIELLGWSTGSCLLIVFLLLPGKFRSRLQAADYLMLAVIVTVFTAHMFYWYSGGPDFGARYWYLMLIPCLVLSIRGFEALQASLLTTGREMNTGRVTVAFASLCLLAFVNYFPWRAVDKYHNYLFMRPDIRYLATANHFGRSLVLIRGERHPDYASAAIYNPLDFSGDDPVYVWDRSQEVRIQALKAFPDRPVWVIEGPSITKGSFKITSGPLTAYQAQVLGHSQ